MNDGTGFTLSRSGVPPLSRHHPRHVQAIGSCYGAEGVTPRSGHEPSSHGAHETVLRAQGRHSTRRGGVRGHHYHGGCAATVQSTAEIDGPTAPLTTSWATACPRVGVARTSWRGSGPWGGGGTRRRSAHCNRATAAAASVTAPSSPLRLASHRLMPSSPTEQRLQRSSTRSTSNGRNSPVTAPPVASHQPLRSIPARGLRGPWRRDESITREP